MFIKCDFCNLDPNTCNNLCCNEAIENGQKEIDSLDYMLFPNGKDDEEWINTKNVSYIV